MSWTGPTVLPCFLAFQWHRSGPTWQTDISLRSQATIGAIMRFLCWLRLTDVPFPTPVGDQSLKLFSLFKNPAIPGTTVQVADRLTKQSLQLGICCLKKKLVGIVAFFALHSVLRKIWLEQLDLWWKLVDEGVEKPDWRGPALLQFGARIKKIKTEEASTFRQFLRPSLTSEAKPTLVGRAPLFHNHWC